MKYLFATLLFLVLQPAFSQTGEVEELVTLYRNEAINGDQNTLVFNHDLQQLEIGDHLIPVSNNTLLSFSKGKGKNLGIVNFMLQKGTAVTSKTDPTYRRASYSIEFRSGKAAKRFLALLEQLKKPRV